MTEEADLRWHKSSYSGNVGSECVEVAEGPRTLVRDTRNRDLACLTFGTGEWSALMLTLNLGE
ncbi:DUF397 domain-containing protein [Nocardiopsis dassonvillei]|uniref:DUF397 domain-containing protein n=1 Tax=Nocardiopsis dassonvillei TaxID=2014 RepID=UPI00200E1A96|nr:DUF397 domain-containing protein [Nocardiopsis dassonvillei]MCK9870311.1 DUF397 domain-containing protein [Nocardiopsis dassonvillei]